MDAVNKCKTTIKKEPSIGNLEEIKEEDDEDKME
jgi:hypothetical protein